MSNISYIKVGQNICSIASPYGTCTSAASTINKTVVCANFPAPTEGTVIQVKFTNANTATAPALNVNSTGAKAIKAYGTVAPTVSWKAGSVVEFTYDGTNWVMSNFGALPTATGEIIATASTITITPDKWVFDGDHHYTLYGDKSVEGEATASIKSAGYHDIGTITSSTFTVTQASVPIVTTEAGSVSVSGSASVSGSGSIDPGTNTISKNAGTNVSSGSATTSKPGSGYYVAVDAATAQNTGSVSVSGTGTATASVSEGFVNSDTVTGGVSASGSASVTVPVKSASTTYIPITSAVLSASGSVGVSGSGNVNPGSNTISKNSSTNVSSGSATTSKPSSGYYVAVDASTAQNTGSVAVSGTGTAMAGVSTAGYAPASLTGSGSVSGSGSASVTVPAKSASTTYIPITSAAISNVTTSTTATAMPLVTTAGYTETKNISAVSVPSGKKIDVSGDVGTYSDGTIDEIDSYQLGTKVTVFTGRNEGGVSGTAIGNLYARSAETTAMVDTLGNASESGTTLINHTAGNVMFGDVGGAVTISNMTTNGSVTIDGIQVADSSGIIYGTITNNTSGGTSSGTINRGKQIKIGAGYYSSARYYTAQANSGSYGTVTSNGTYTVDGYKTITVNVSSTVTYTITNSLTNCSAYAYNPTSVISGGNVILKYSPNSGYALPTSMSSISVTNATKRSWDSTSGTLCLSNVTGNVTVSITAVVATYTLTFSSNFISNWRSYCSGYEDRVKLEINGTTYKCYDIDSSSSFSISSFRIWNDDGEQWWIDTNTGETLYAYSSGWNPQTLTQNTQLTDIQK